MNERIQELAEQAGINCVVPTVGTLEYPSKGEVDHLKSFAELIVRESIVDFYRNYLDTTSDDDITEQVDRYEKQNFGVG